MGHSWDDRSGSGHGLNAGLHALVCVPAQLTCGIMGRLQVIQPNHTSHTADIHLRNAPANCHWCVWTDTWRFPWGTWECTIPQRFTTEASSSPTWRKPWSNWASTSSASSSTCTGKKPLSSSMNRLLRQEEPVINPNFVLLLTYIWKCSAHHFSLVKFVVNKSLARRASTHLSFSASFVWML